MKGRHEDIVLWREFGFLFVDCYGENSDSRLFVDCYIENSDSRLLIAAVCGRAQSQTSVLTVALQPVLAGCYARAPHRPIIPIETSPSRVGGGVGSRWCCAYTAAVVAVAAAYLLFLSCIWRYIFLMFQDLPCTLILEYQCNESEKDAYTPTDHKHFSKSRARFVSLRPQPRLSVSLSLMMTAHGLLVTCAAKP